MAITTALVLILSNISAPFRIEADSFNKLLSIVEYNYKIYNKEMLVVIQALKE